MTNKNNEHEVVWIQADALEEIINKLQAAESEVRALTDLIVDFCKMTNGISTMIDLIVSAQGEYGNKDDLLKILNTREVPIPIIPDVF